MFECHKENSGTQRQTLSRSLASDFLVSLLRGGFRGLEVVCWPLVPKFAGSNPAKTVGFLRVNKNPQHVGGHGCLSVVIVVCCQVEVSATN